MIADQIILEQYLAGRSKPGEGRPVRLFSWSPTEIGPAEWSWGQHLAEDFAASAPETALLVKITPDLPRKAAAERLRQLADCLEDPDVEIAEDELAVF